MAGHIKHKIEIYCDAKGEFRWRLRAHNGHIVAESGEGYASKGGCERGWERVALVIYDGHWTYA